MRYFSFLIQKVSSPESCRVFISVFKLFYFIDQLNHVTVPISLDRLLHLFPIFTHAAFLFSPFEWDCSFSWNFTYGNCFEAFKKLYLLLKITLAHQQLSITLHSPHREPKFRLQHHRGSLALRVSRERYWMCTMHLAPRLRQAASFLAAPPMESNSSPNTEGYPHSHRNC